MAAQRAYYPDPPLNPYESPGSYYSHAPYPRAYEQPVAYDHAPITQPPGEWRLPERPTGRDGLPLFPARPPQPYVPRYMNEREAVLLQYAPQRETEHLQGPGNLAYLDVPAYNPPIRTAPPLPDRVATPRTVCPRCGPNCLCNQTTVTASRSRPVSAVPPRPVCTGPCPEVGRGPAPKPMAPGVCQRCGASCACNCGRVGEKVIPGQAAVSAPPTTSPVQLRKWMDLPQGAAKITDRLFQYRQDHKISGYGGFFPNTHNLLGGSIYRLTTNER